MSLSTILLTTLVLLWPVASPSDGDAAPPGLSPCPDGTPGVATYEVRGADGTLVGHLVIGLKPKFSGGFGFRFEPLPGGGGDGAILAALLSDATRPVEFFAPETAGLEMFFDGGLLVIGPPKPRTVVITTDPYLTYRTYEPTEEPLLEGWLDPAVGGGFVVPFGGQDVPFSLGNPVHSCF